MLSGSVMNVESQGYVNGKKNETGEGCLPGGKTHFCPQRLKSAPLTTVTKVSVAGFMVYTTVAFQNRGVSELSLSF